MSIWVDEQISPAIASWIAVQFGKPAAAVRDLGLARAADLEIFRAAREANAILITKDQDFVRLLGRLSRGGGRCARQPRWPRPPFGIRAERCPPLEGRDSRGSLTDPLISPRA